MISETFLQIAQLSTILIGFLGVAVTLRSHRRQMHAQMFIEFSARFHDVLRTLPSQTWTGADEPVPPPTEDLTRSCLQCFHVIAEVYLLYRRGYISQDLWRPWERGMRRTMQTPLMQREWLAVEGAFSHVPELRRYMRALVHDTPTPRREWSWRQAEDARPASSAFTRARNER